MGERPVSLRTEPFAAEREWTVEGVPVLSAAVRVPQPEPAADKISRRIKRFYQLQCRSFLHYCEQQLLPQAAAEYRAALAASSPLPAFRAELDYQITYNQDGFWSLYTQGRETIGTGRALLTRRGDTWDLAAGYPVPLKDFFPAGMGWKKRLITHAEKEILRRERAGVTRWKENWRRELRRCFNPQNFYLTAEGLAWFYPMYAIAPGQEGIPVFLLSYDKGVKLEREAE
ncbi:MAG: RsiV family protein [Dysosmobacter sp.]|nr:RsiV family protein [Dysosmobacter sp.]